MRRAGQVGVLTKNPGLYGRLVQWFTGSPAFHTIFAVDGHVCVSAETPTIRLRPLSHFRDVVWLNVEYPSAAKREDAIDFALGTVGKPYAYWDIVLLVISKILKKKTPQRILDRIQDRRQYFCSELTDDALQVGGVNLFPDLPSQVVTPDDFLKVALSAQSPQDVTQR